MMVHCYGCFRHSVIDCNFYFIESQHECNFQHIYRTVVGLLRGIPYVEIVPADVNLLVAELLYLIWNPHFRNFINVIWNRNEKHIQKTSIICGFSLFMLLIILPPESLVLKNDFMFSMTQHIVALI